VRSEIYHKLSSNRQPHLLSEMNLAHPIPKQDSDEYKYNSNIEDKENGITQYHRK